MVRTLEETLPEETLSTLVKAIQKKSYFKKRPDNDQRKRSESRRSDLRVVEVEDEQEETGKEEEESYIEEESSHTSGKITSINAVQSEINISRLT